MHYITHTGDSSLVWFVIWLSCWWPGFESSWWLAFVQTQVEELTNCKVILHQLAWLMMVQGPLWYCVCIINSYTTLLNWPIVRLLILFDIILLSNGFFCILVHDYTLCFTGSPCYNVSYYNYISIWPYSIVIHLADNHF